MSERPELSLPTDIATLQAMLRAEQTLRIELETRLAQRDQEIDTLRLQLAKLRRAQFGRSSEQGTPGEMGNTPVDQLELRLEDLEMGVTERTGEPFVPSQETSGDTPRRAVRKPLPESLPREALVREPECVTAAQAAGAACACPACGGHLKSLGEDVSEWLEYVPGRFKVIRQIRPKYACTGCEAITQAPALSRPIERSNAGAGLLAHVITNKYCDHLPLYRQSAIFAREGIELERSTLADWVGACSRLLSPLVEELSRYVKAADKVHADDTPVPVLAPGKGQTKTGRLWTYVRDDRPAGRSTAPAVWFAYSPDRKGEHPQTHLEKFKGLLQADAYAGFNKLYESGLITPVACWAHARRKFHELASAQASPLAAEALRQIGALYRIEEKVRGKPPEIRQATRQAEAMPILTALHDWLRETLAKLSQKSALADAIRYALNHWEALCAYTRDGRAEIDNNAAERALRTIAIGRKNYLFAGSDSGGITAAALYSLIGTAKLNDIDPQAYLHYVLERIADTPITRVAELLPWNCAAQLSKTAG